MLNNRLLLLIIEAEIQSQVQAQIESIIMRRQKVSEVTEPINRPGSPRHRINPGEMKIQAIL